MERGIRELCQLLLSTEDEAVFHALAEELRQALHQHVEGLRYEAQQLDVANRLLDPPALLSTAPSEPAGAPSGQLKPSPDPAPLSTVVIQLPSKPKRKSRRSPPAA